jgi:hypothetical protein
MSVVAHILQTDPLIDLETSVFFGDVLSEGYFEILSTFRYLEGL